MEEENKSTYELKAKNFIAFELIDTGILINIGIDSNITDNELTNFTRMINQVTNGKQNQNILIVLNKVGVADKIKSDLVDKWTNLTVLEKQIANKDKSIIRPSHVLKNIK